MASTSLSPSTARVLSTLIRAGSASRAELAQATGLTAGGVTRAVQPLTRSGLVRESAPRRGEGMGRPTTSLQLQAGHELHVGVKVTATDLVSVVCDLRGRVLASSAEPLRAPEPELVLQQVADTVVRWSQTHPRVRRVGVAVSGDVDSAAGHVSYSPFLGWREVSARAVLERATGLPVVVANDVRALLTGEHLVGTGAGAASLAMVTIGTGIGCALLLQGHIVQGSHGVAGEIGHVLVDPSGPPCHCGNTGCVEAIASEAAILARLAGSLPAGATLGHVAALARDGHPTARAALEDAGTAIGVGLATLANLFGPEIIVVTGEAVVGPDEDYSAMELAVRRAFMQRAFGSAGDCELVVRPSTFVDWARGAAACALAERIGQSNRVPDDKGLSNQ